MNLVIVAADERFIRPAAVALKSARDHADSDSTRAVFIDCGCEPESLYQLECSWPGLSIQTLDVTMFEEFRTQRPRGALARLALEQYLTEDADRILYLDSDVLVRRSLEDLFLEPLHGFALGAVPALSRPVMGYDNEDPWPETEYFAGGAAPGGVVFNSGVLLIDIARWSALEILSRATRLGRQFDVSDQRILNSLLSRDWLPLDTRWNTKSADAFIYHFAADPRPWQRHYYRNSIWLEYIETARSIGWTIDTPPLLATRIAAHSAASRARRLLP